MFGGLKSLAQPVADTIHRIRAVLAQVYGLYPRSGGGIVVRQAGGTAGTDEVQISHNGTRGLVQSLDGNLVLSTATGPEITVKTDNTFEFGASGTIIFGTRSAASSGGFSFVSGSTITWASSSTQYYTGIDVGFSRAAAGVLKVTDGSTGGGWQQQAAARSRVNSAVTNTTITPAAITGLSHTLIAGRKYTGRLVLYAAVPTSADGIRIDFDGGTATMTSFIAQGVLSDDTSTRKLARTTALATDITDTDLNGEAYIVIEFGLVCNAAGTFIPRIAKEADAAGATLTVLANSFLWLEDMP